MSLGWEDAHSDCSRGLVRLWLRHGTLLSALRDLRTSGVAVPFVIERLSNTPARLPEASPHLSRACQASGERNSHSNPTPSTRSRERHTSVTLLAARCTQLQARGADPLSARARHACAGDTTRCRRGPPAAKPCARSLRALMLLPVPLPLLPAAWRRATKLKGLSPSPPLYLPSPSATSRVRCLFRDIRTRGALAKRGSLGFGRGKLEER